MPVKGLRPNANLDHLKYQAKDLLKAHAARDPQVAQRIRECHPKFEKFTDSQIFKATLRLTRNWQLRGSAGLRVGRD